MSLTITCVRCGSTTPRPTDRRARCAKCGTALPIFEDDPSFPVPVLPKLDLPAPPRRPAAHEAGGRTPPSGSPAAHPPLTADLFEDFKLESTDELELQVKAAAALAPPTPAPAPAPAQASRPAPAAQQPDRQAPPRPEPRRGKAIPLAAAALALLLGAGSFLFLRGGAASAPAPTAAPRAEATRPSVPDSVELAPPPASSPRPAPADAEPVVEAVVQAPPTARAVPAAAAQPARGAETARAAARPQAEARPPAARVALARSLPAPAATPPTPAPTAPAARAPGEAPLPPPPPGMRQVVEAPVYPGEGFKKPRPAEPTCIRDALQLPRDLTLGQDEVVTVRFAVGPDGAATAFSVLSTPSDPRLGTVIWSAVQRCRFVPGSDSRGNPALVWLVMPVRFAAL